jgi:hypothetical protein
MTAPLAQLEADITAIKWLVDTVNEADRKTVTAAGAELDVLTQRLVRASWLTRPRVKREIVAASHRFADLSAMRQRNQKCLFQLLDLAQRLAEEAGQIAQRRGAANQPARQSRKSRRTA